MLNKSRLDQPFIKSGRIESVTKRELTFISGGLYCFCNIKNNNNLWGGLNGSKRVAKRSSVASH